MSLPQNLAEAIPADPVRVVVPPQLVAPEPGPDPVLDPLLEAPMARRPRAERRRHRLPLAARAQHEQDAVQHPPVQHDRPPRRHGRRGMPVAGTEIWMHTQDWNRPDVLSRALTALGIPADQLLWRLYRVDFSNRRHGRDLGGRVGAARDAGGTLDDILFVRADRAGVLGDTGCFGPPDLVVEALSPTSIQRDLVDKLGIYERGGVAHYWVVGVANGRLRRFALVDGRYQEQPPLGRDDALVSPLFPGLHLPLRPIFAAAHQARELARQSQAPDVDLDRVRFLERWYRQRPGEKDQEPRRGQ
jgi:Uma2 family endonuclease